MVTNDAIWILSDDCKPPMDVPVCCYGLAAVPCGDLYFAPTECDVRSNYFVAVYTTGGWRLRANLKIVEVICWTNFPSLPVIGRFQSTALDGARRYSLPQVRLMERDFFNREENEVCEA